MNIKLVHQTIRWLLPNMSAKPIHVANTPTPLPASRITRTSDVPATDSGRVGHGWQVAHKPKTGHAARPPFRATVEDSTCGKFVWLTKIS